MISVSTPNATANAITAMVILTFFGGFQYQKRLTADIGVLP